MQKIITATGVNNVDLAIAKELQDNINFQVIGAYDKKKDLLLICEKYQPNILIISDALFGNENLTKLLIDIKKSLEDIRIVYLTSPSRDKQVLSDLSLLVDMGIYDIARNKNFTIDFIVNLIKNPKDVSYVQDLQLKRENRQENVKFIIDDFYDEKAKRRAKIVICSSIKPGSGKSFLSVNLATGIAKYGKDHPKVCLIEGDLQNLSIGTLLGLEDTKKTLKTAMDKIATIVSKTGELEASPYQIEEVNRFILNCFVPYKHKEIDNLYCLVGSELTFNEVSSIYPSYYAYLIEAIADEFDVIIIDTNSSVSHTTTLPLLEFCDKAYYVINLDFNNIKNNVRYRELLKEIGIAKKVKYVLNEAINKDKTSNLKEDLLFSQENIVDAGFDLVTSIPIVDKSVFFNRLFTGEPIILDENINYTEDAKGALLKVCEDVYPCENKFGDKEAVIKKKKGFFNRW